MIYRRLNLFVAAALMAILVPAALISAAESAEPQHDQAEPAASTSNEPAAAKEQEEAEDGDQSTRDKPPLLATQGTPVLGVIIGKRIGVEAAEVVRVWPGSPAEQAGLQKGDQITRVDDEEIRSPEAFRVAVLDREPGTRVRLTVRRDGEPQTLEAQLGGADGLAGWTRRGQLPEVPDAPAWLGVRVAPVLSARKPGVIVTRVFPGGPADTAGLQKGDAILQVDKTRVEAASDLKMAVLGREPGQTVELVVRRDDQRKTVGVELSTFVEWHADVFQLTDGEVRDLLHELLTAPLLLAEELLPGQPSNGDTMEDQVELPKMGVAELTPTEGNEAGGTIMLRQAEDGLHITGNVTGLTPGLHGFHIHQYGDLRAPDGSAAGGHFNPAGTAHGGPQDEERHAGDLGNIKADEDGVAEVDIHVPWLELHFVIGRAIVVHAGEDDFASQPSGDAGPRVAIGVIGIAEQPQRQARASGAD
jgi:superoxide dismutase, Cu-Zn family